MSYKNLAMVIKRRGVAQTFTPVQLEDAFIMYVKDNEENTMFRNEPIKSGNSAGMIMQVPVTAPLSARSFCLFAGLSFKTFTNYMNPSSSTYPAYHEIAEWILQYCNDDIFKGAMTGFFNGNLAFSVIKKDLNLGEDESTDSRNVGKIIHEVHFSDFQTPKGLPNNVEDGTAEIVGSLADDKYDNLPPRHSRDYDTAQMREFTEEELALEGV